MGTGYKNRGSGAAGLGFKNRGAKLVEGAAYTNRGATDGVNEAFKNRGQAWGSDAYYNRGPNDFASLSVLGLAAFYAPLTHSLILTRGTGDPTYSRATTAYEFGYAAAANSGDAQVLLTIPSGTPRFGGARYNSGTWYETYADGSAISESSLLGYHAEGSRTNSVLDSRDLTNAAWAATNITPAKTATGIDNAANSASTITAGAADATILQTLSLAAAARSFSAYVKRRTGTGNVYITRDGGTNWTDITSSLGASWTRVKIENTSVLNPQVGFKIATSGDAIDVDCVQDEAGAFISSPIITTTAAVTRNEDRLLYQKASNMLDASGSALCSWCIDDSGTTYGAASRNALVVDSNGRMIRGASFADVTTANIYDGVNSITSTGGAARNNSTHKKAASAWESATAKVITQGGLLISGTYDGTMGAGASIDVGGNASGATLFGYIKNVYTWTTALTDAQLQQVTA